MNLTRAAGSLASVFSTLFAAALVAGVIALGLSRAAESRVPNQPVYTPTRGLMPLERARKVCVAACVSGFSQARLDGSGGYGPEFRY